MRKRGIIHRLDVKFSHTRRDRRTQLGPISGKFNSRIINALRFNTTAGATKVQASLSASLIPGNYQ